VFPLNNLDSPPDQHFEKVVPLKNIMEFTASYISY